MKIIYKSCTISDIFRIIGHKWTLLILCDLSEGTKRFGELQNNLNGISPRTLSIRLDQLEQNGIVIKKVYIQIPLKVEYSLTDKGRLLGEIVMRIREWDEKFS